MQSTWMDNEENQLIDGGFIQSALSDGEGWDWIAENLPGTPRYTPKACKARYLQIVRLHKKAHGFPYPESAQIKRNVAAAMRRRQRHQAEEREALRCSFLNFYGLSARQVAKLMGITEATILRRHQRVRWRRPDLGIPAWRKNPRAGRVPEAKILGMKAMRDAGASYSAIAKAFGYQSDGAAQITLKRGLERLAQMG